MLILLLFSCAFAEKYEVGDQTSPSYARGLRLYTTIYNRTYNDDNHIDALNSVIDLTLFDIIYKNTPDMRRSTRQARITPSKIDNI